VGVNGGGGGGWHCQSVVVVVDGSDNSIVWQRQVYGFTHIPTSGFWADKVKAR
jgi:hypothetical protein